MTIAFGILASDGVLLCADSEISNTDFKGTDSKMVSAVHEMYSEVKSSLAVAGSGSWNYFQSLRLHVVNEVFGSLGTDAKSDSRLEKRLEKFMLSFHDKHVTPYLKLKHPPFVDVIVATRNGGRNQLWATENSSVRQAVIGYDAIGIGQLPAKELLHSYYRGPMPLEAAILLACYVSMRTCYVVPGCGKDTSIVVLGDGRPVHVPRKLIKQCEQAFENYHEFHTHAFHLMLGNGPSGVPMQSHFNLALQDFGVIRQEIRATISSMAQT